MRYIDVRWMHERPDYPVRLVSEIANDGFETRKIEYYADGRLGFADETSEVGGALLGEGPIPPLDEINADPEFEGNSLTPAQFERLWQAATSRVA